MIKFTLPVIPRTKKNSGRIVTNKRGRSFLLPSKLYQEFESKCLPFLRKVMLANGVIDYPVNIRCTFYTQTKRKVDLANLLNAVDDAFTTAGLLLDDNRDIVAGHDGSRVFYDKTNPRIEVEITKLENYEQWKK